MSFVVRSSVAICGATLLASFVAANVLAKPTSSRHAAAAPTRVSRNGAQCAVSMSSQNSVIRLAGLIHSSGGKPAGVGPLLAAAADAISAGAASPTLEQILGTTRNQYSMGQALDSTFAQPVTAAQVGAISPGDVTRSTQSARRINRTNGSTPNYYIFCPYGYAAAAQWYCPGGATCTGVAVTLEGVVMSKKSICYPPAQICGVTDEATVPITDAVDYFFFSQSTPGTPLVSEVWCLW